MEFDNHYCVELKDESTGRYAFEFLIDRIAAMPSVPRDVMRLIVSLTER